MLMEALALYALKSSACLAVFYLFFKLLLSRDTLHRFNRLLLLHAMLLAFVLPLCVITVTREVVVAPMPALPLELPAEWAIEVPAAEQPFDWGRLLGGIYLAGVGTMLLATAVSMLRVARMIRRGRHEALPGGWTLVRLPQATTPFSWWRYAVVSEEEPAEGFEQILTHETAHLRLHHSLDLLLTDVAGCLQWFNPAMWLLRRELRAIHEYEADEAVLASGADARQYQLMLIKKAAGRRWYSVANSFNHSNLKNRITMMLQNRSSRWARAKALVAVPLVCVALGAFARTVEVPVADKVSKNSAFAEVLAENPPQTEAANPAQQLASTPAPTPALAIADAQPQPEAAQTTLRLHATDAATGEELPGVVVQVQGSHRGVVTDMQGRATLEVDDPVTIDLLLAGYKPVQIQTDGPTTRMSGRGSMQSEVHSTQSGVRRTTSIEVQLAADAAEASAEGGEIVRSVRSVRSEQASDFVERLQESPQPLCLLDGNPVEDLQAIDPKRIESITVLKAPEAVAPYFEKYGDRAKNGVALIRMKTEHARSQDTPEAADTETPEVAQIEVNSASTVLRIQSAEQPVPLYLLNGKPIEGTLAIDPAQIESIDVLKDPQSLEPYIEQYGDRARHGVVLIRLKKAMELSLQANDYFQSDEWKAARQQLQQVNSYFRSDAWRAAWQQMLEANDSFPSDAWKKAAARWKRRAAYEKKRWKKTAARWRREARFAPNDTWKNFLQPQPAEA